MYSTDLSKQKPASAFALLSKHTQTPAPSSRGTRPLHRRNSIVVIKHNVPVNPIPPALQVLILTRDTVVHHPRVLPGVDTQNGLYVNGTGGQVLLVLRVGAHGSGELVAERRIGGVGSHVDGLTTGVGGWVGGAGVVGAEDLHEALALEVLGEPDEARAEHGAGGCEEVELEGFDGGAGVDDVLGELFGDLGGGGGLEVGWELAFCTFVVSVDWVEEGLTRQLKKKWLLWAMEA